MSFFQAPSSLQRAVKHGQDNNEEASSPQQRRSSFETCFAAGLDLSEFGESNSSPSCASNAAALLRIKQQKAAVKGQQELEESRLQQAVQQRIQAFQQEQTESNSKQKLYRILEKTQTTVWTEPLKQTSLERASKLSALRKTNNAIKKAKNNSDLVDALVGMMHQNDETMPRTNRRHRNKIKSSTRMSLKRPPPPQQQQSKNKVRPVKRTRKCKH